MRRILFHLLAAIGASTLIGAVWLAYQMRRLDLEVAKIDQRQRRAYLSKGSMGHVNCKCEYTAYDAPITSAYLPDALLDQLDRALREADSQLFTFRVQLPPQVETFLKEVTQDF